MPKDTKAKPEAAQRYKLKVTLVGSRPPIWRRLIVPSDVTLEEMHRVIQVAFGWTNSHLHQFYDTGRTTHYSDPEFELDDTEDETQVHLGQLLRRPKQRILYEYDFGDGWQHQVELEKVLPPPDDGKRVAQCTAGRRAGPPEDVGGVWGYAELLEAIKNPGHDRHEEFLDWVGGDFDPEACDVDEITPLLKKTLLR